MAAGWLGYDSPRPFRRVGGPGNEQATTRGCQFLRRGEKLGSEPGDHPRPNCGDRGPRGGGDRARDRLLQRQRRPPVHARLPERRPARARQPGADRRLAGRLGRKHRAHRRQPRRSPRRSRTGAARGDDGGDPRHLALRRRQPLRLDQPRARTATRRSTTAPKSASRSTTTPIDIDQFFNTFPPSVRKGLSNFIKGNATIYAGQGEAANDAYKYFGPALNRTDAFVRELNADQRLFEQLRRQLQQAGDHGRRARRGALQRDLQRQHRLRRDRHARTSPSTRRCGGCRRSCARPTRPSSTSAPRSTTSTRWSKRRSRRPRTWRRSWPNCARCSRNSCRFIAQPAPHRRPARQGQRRRRTAGGAADGAAAGLDDLPARRRRDRRLPAEPQLHPRLHAGPLQRRSASSARSPATTTATATTCAPRPSPQNLFNYEGGTLKPITKGQQFDVFGSSAPVPHAAARAAPPRPPPTAPTRSSTRRIGGSSVSPSECNPADVPPGP